MEEFEAAFGRLSCLSYRVAFRILGDRLAAEDVAQESAARAYVRWHRVHGYADAWCARVAGNLALDVVRANRRRGRPGDDRDWEPAGQVIAEERLDLQRALQNLPRRQRQVVVLRYVADLPERDVAAALSCSVGTVKAHASRGLAVLRRHLDTTPCTTRSAPAPDTRTG